MIFKKQQAHILQLLTTIQQDVVLRSFNIDLQEIDLLLQSIFQAAIYMHTQGVSGGAGFPVKLLKDAMYQGGE